MNILLIVFNSHVYDENKFELENVLSNIFNELSIKVNILFMRDKRCSWYYYGVKGFSDNYLETEEDIKKIMDELKIKKLMCMDSSAGGYM